MVNIDKEIARQILDDETMKHKHILIISSVLESLFAKFYNFLKAKKHQQEISK